MSQERRRKSASPHSAASRTPSKGRRRARKRKSAARQRRRQQRLLILLVLCIALMGAGLGAIVLIRNGLESRSMTLPFKSREVFAMPLLDKTSMRAVPFASDLAIVEGDVPLAGSSLTPDESGLLINLNQKKVLFSQKSTQRVYPASITKLVTAILVLQHANLEDSVTIADEDIYLEEQAQVCGFYTGDVLTVRQLLNCLLVYSGNDAAMALARHVGGSVEGFVQMMNDYASSLGCTGTHFVNPHGLHNDEHYTTPYDIYLILKEAVKIPEFTQISQLPSYTVEYTRPNGTFISTPLMATDHYLTGEASPPRDVSILGGKTGTTSLAGNCLALLCSNAYGQPFVSIVMGASTKELLYDQMNSLLQSINS